MNESPICIFDMDDTLVDSWHRMEECVLILLDEAGIRYDREEMISMTVPRGVKGAAQLFYELGAGDSAEDVLIRMNQRMVDFYRDRVGAKPGVIPFLKALKAQNVRLLVLSATPTHLVKLCLEQNRMLPLFEEIWSTEDFGTDKGDPDLFLQVAKRLETAPGRICYFEDNPTALANAKRVGYKTFGVQNPHAALLLRDHPELYHVLVEDFTKLSLSDPFFR